jgi:prenyltransferase beta subunit
MATPCETLRNELIDLAKGESNPEAQAHLDGGCVTCAEELAQLTTIVGLLGRMPAPQLEAPSHERVSAAARAADWADTPDETAAIVQVAGLLAALPEPAPQPGFAKQVVAQAQIADLLQQLPAPQPSAGAAKRVVAAALAAETTDSGIIKLSDYMKDRARKAPIWVATIAVHAAAILVLASIAIAPRTQPVNPTSVAVAPDEEPAPEEHPEEHPENPDAVKIPAPIPGPVEVEPRLDPGDLEEFEDTTPPTFDPWGGSQGGSRVEGRPSPEDLVKPVSRDLEKERRIRTQVLAWIGSRLERNRSDAHRAAGTTGWEPHIARGLEWLRRTQLNDGSWRPSAHGGSDDHTTGLTALAVMAFAAQGHCATDGTDDANVVSQAVKYLWKQQDIETGRFGPDGRVHLYSHALAMMAIGETHALDILNYLKLSDSYSRHFLTKGVHYLAAAQREDGGWGYRPGADRSDTSVTVWQIAALDVAKRVGIEGAAAPLERAKAWLRRMSDAQGRFGYEAPGSFPKEAPALAAAGKWGQLLLNDDGRGSEADAARAALLRKNLPGKIGAKPNVYAWYYGSLVMRDRGGEDWTAWREALAKTVTGAQSTDGSWPATGDRFAQTGGRLYTTTLNVLSLQTPARYSK